MTRASGAIGFSKTAADQWAAGKGIASATPVLASFGNSICGGDSSVGDHFNGSSGSNVTRNANGYLAWALALSGQRVRLPAATHVWSYPGQTMEYIAARKEEFWDSLMPKPGVVCIEGGTNSLTGGGTFATMTAATQELVEFFTRKACRVIIVPILPRASSALSAAQFGLMDRYNRWLTHYAQTAPQMMAVASSCLRDLTDIALTGGAQPKAGMYYDNTHPQVTAAFYIGKAIAAILSTWFPPIDLLPTNNLSYNSVSAPFANLLLNPMMTGSGGAVSTPSSGTITGTAPSSWTVSVSNTAGLTVAHSQVTSALTGLPMHQMVFGGSYTVSGAATPSYGVFGRLQQSVPTANLPAIQSGDTLEALIAFEIDAGAVGLAFPSLEFRWGGPSLYNGDLMPVPGFAYTGGVLPGEAISGVLRAPVHTFTSQPASGEVVMNLFARLVSVNGTYNPSGTVRFGRAVVQKVEVM